MIQPEQLALLEGHLATKIGINNWASGQEGGAEDVAEADSSYGLNLAKSEAMT